MAHLRDRRRQRQTDVAEAHHGHGRLAAAQAGQEAVVSEHLGRPGHQRTVPPQGTSRSRAVDLMTLPTDTASGVVQRQPVTSNSRLVSGTRRPTSRAPAPCTDSYGRWTIGEVEPVHESTRAARSAMATSSVLPMLKIPPTAAGDSSRWTIARTTSPTCVKQRRWLPSPWITSGRPVSALVTNAGTTMP